MADPWEMLPTETTKAWAAFVAYRDMGPSRSHQKVSQLLGKTSNALVFWSTDNHWVERARAWDAHLDARHRAQMLSEVEQMTHNHATIARAMTSKASQRLVKIDPDDLTPDNVTRMVETGIRLERLSHGLSTDNVALRFVSIEDMERILEGLGALLVALSYYVAEERRDDYSRDAQSGIAGLLGRPTDGDRDVIDQPAEGQS